MMTPSNGNIFRVTGPRGIHRSPVNSPHKGQWRGALMFSLIWAWTNRCVNNREAGNLWHHRAHYDGAVMRWKFRSSNPPISELASRHISCWMDGMYQRHIYFVVNNYIIRVCIIVLGLSRHLPGNRASPRWNNTNSIKKFSMICRIRKYLIRELIDECKI